MKMRRNAPKPDLVARARAAYEGGMSMAQAGALVNRSAAAIQAWAKQGGWPVRTRGNPEGTVMAGAIGRNPEILAMARARYEAGDDARAIAEAAGVTRGCVWHWARRDGWPVRKVGRPRKGEKA